MTSSAQRGAYYKARTKRWLESEGYQVADLEKVHWIFRNGQREIPVKRDQFGSDLLAVSGRRLVFIQVKSGKITGNFPEARRAFDSFRFPPFAGRLVIAWAHGASTPRIVNMAAPPPERSR